MDFRHPAVAAITAVAGLAVVAVLLFSSSGGQQPTGLQTLNGASFATAYQASWHLAMKQSRAGFVRYQLSSTGAPISGLGIAPAGTIGVTIDEAPTSALRVLHLQGATPDMEAETQSAVELLPHVVGVPGQAQGMTRSVLPHKTALAGADAAEEAYTYSLAGRQIVQVDVLSHRDGRVILVELDAEPTMASVSQAALETIEQHWHWH